jgi:hypothetical protein
MAPIPARGYQGNSKPVNAIDYMEDSVNEAL